MLQPPMPVADARAAMGTLYFDLTAATHPTAMDGLLTITTADHLLFGSDVPFMSPGLIPAAKAAISVHPGFDAAGRAAIARGTAAKLFPKLAARI